MAMAWGARALDEIAATDIEAMPHQMVATARSRRNSRHTGEHVIAAARAIYNRAIADGLIHPAASPAHRVALALRLADLDTERRLVQLREKGNILRPTGTDDHAQVPV